MKTPKKQLDNYEFRIVEEEFIPNRENAERIIYTIEFDYEGDTIRFTPPAFTVKQVATGQWEQQACRQIDKKIVSLKDNYSEYKIESMKGKKIENSGYDFT